MLWGKLQTIPASALKPENRTKQNRVKRSVTIYCQFCPLTIRKRKNRIFRSETASPESMPTNLEFAEAIIYSFPEVLLKYSFGKVYRLACIGEVKIYNTLSGSRPGKGSVYLPASAKAAMPVPTCRQDLRIYIRFR
jgi:hypothetical protein